MQQQAVQSHAFVRDCCVVQGTPVTDKVLGCLAEQAKTAPMLPDEHAMTGEDDMITRQAESELCESAVLCKLHLAV